MTSGSTGRPKRVAHTLQSLTTVAADQPARRWLCPYAPGTYDRVGGGTANIAHLGGLLFGYLYLKFVPRRGLTFAFSESFFGLRNSYHRWKRRQAAKKFEVYMRKHEKEPRKYFDEYGNFKPPDDGEKKDGGKGGWVN